MAPNDDGYGNQDVRFAAPAPSQDVRYSGSGDVREQRGGATRHDGWFARKDGRRGDESFEELEIFGERKAKNTDGIDFDQYDRIPVDVTGDRADEYKPIALFPDFKLSEQLSWNLDRCGYQRPTPVQKYAIPIVVGGRDLMACAQTGSGKTCAFMVPCIESLLKSGPPPPPNSRGRPIPHPCALVLAPTRELATQIHDESLKFAFNTGVKSRLIYGGADIREQVREMNKGTDMLVATPGRLTDMIGREYVDLGLIQFLILDEADRMLDMGFEPQVREIVADSGMGRKVEKRRQSMMFSATFAANMQAMAGDFLQDYLFITVGRVGSCNEMIEQSLIYAQDGPGKNRALERVYREHAPPQGQLTVVFVETKRKADEIEADLWNAGLRCCCIHGDREQHEREIALEAFKSGECPILVATDVAARGLDISNVGLVINYDMPKQMDDYVHRIGRTGRAGKKGRAIGFVNERCRYCAELAELMRGANQVVPDWLQQLAKEASAAYGKGGKGKGKATGVKDARLETGAVGKAEAEKLAAADKEKADAKAAADKAAADEKKRLAAEAKAEAEREIPDDWDADSD